MAGWWDVLGGAGGADLCFETYHDNSKIERRGRPPSPGARPRAAAGSFGYAGYPAVDLGEPEFFEAVTPSRTSLAPSPSAHRPRFSYQSSSSAVERS